MSDPVRITQDATQAINGYASEVVTSAIEVGEKVASDVGASEARFAVAQVAIGRMAEAKDRANINRVLEYAAFEACRVDSVGFALNTVAGIAAGLAALDNHSESGCGSVEIDLGNVDDLAREAVEVAKDEEVDA